MSRTGRCLLKFIFPFHIGGCGCGAFHTTGAAKDTAAIWAGRKSGSKCFSV